MKVYGNTFRHDPDRVGSRCTFTRACGINAILSNYGTYPEWSPYKGTVVQKAITFRQNNTFYDNTYEGSWRFQPFEQGNLKNFAQWRRSPPRPGCRQHAEALESAVGVAPPVPEPSVA